MEDYTDPDNEDLTGIELVPEKFTEARKRARITQAQAARAIGLHRSAMNRVERGRRLLSATALARFCLLTNAQISELTNVETVKAA